MRAYDLYDKIRSSCFDWHCALVWFIWTGLFAFVTCNVTFAATYISQSYLTNNQLPVGSIVSLKKDTTDQVVAADYKNVGNLLGVVVNAGNSILSLTNNKGDHAEVATSGTLQVLVSDINGSVQEGDQITASPISGVGMKANTNVRVVGIAQGELSDSNGSEQSYTDKDGKKKKVLIGQIPVQVSVSYFYKEPEKTLIPTAIQNIANALAGKTVSTLPILISTAIFIITVVVVVSIIFAMIRSSIISVGRNPMSQSAIYRDLVQLSALVLVILAVGVISIYLVLTRM
jgi:hypothetical protein